MKERKNIENLFQEKFEQFEITPPENVWSDIKLKLEEKKQKRRVIPFWWKLSGIAAAFIVGFFILNTNSDAAKPSQEIITNKENKEVTNTTNAIVNSKENNNSEEIISKGNNNSEENNAVISNPSSQNTIAIKEDNAVKNSENKTSGTSNGTNSLNSSKAKNSKLNKATNNTSIATNSKNLKKKKNNINYNNEEIAIAETNKSQNSSNKKSSSFKKNESFAALNSDKNSNIKSILESKSQNDFIEKNTNSSNSNFEKSTAFEDKITLKNNTNSFDNNLNNKLNDQKISYEITKIDSTKIAVVEPNALEELLKEKEKGDKKIAEQKLNRWQIATNVAPIYFSSTDNGSPLDSKFENNSKSYNSSLSYGFGVDYAVSKKLKLRARVNSIVMDYNTNDVVFFQKNDASKIQNVKSNDIGSVIQIENRSQAQPFINSNGSVSNKFNSSLNQKLGYVEIPMEISYSLINKKIGVQVIGGMSTLFLNQNEISLVSPGLDMQIGEADNLNQVHFSGNLGLGFKYGFLKRFEAHLEPVFKYQINTFSNDAGNFKPILFGVYSGISFSF